MFFSVHSSTINRNARMNPGSKKHPDYEIKNQTLHLPCRNIRMLQIQDNIQHSKQKISLMNSPKGRIQSAIIAKNQEWKSTRKGQFDYKGYKSVDGNLTRKHHVSYPKSAMDRKSNTLKLQKLKKAPSAPPCSPIYERYSPETEDFECSALNNITSKKEETKDRINHSNTSPTRSYSSSFIQNLTSPSQNLFYSDQLNLNNNRLTKIPTIENPSRIRYLNLGCNRLSKITDMKFLSHLVFIDLHDNQIVNLDESLNTLLSLRILLLGNNRIDTIQNVNKLINLDILDMTSNCISRIEKLHTLKHLRVLNLAGNKIRKADNLKELTSLVELNLSRNSIEKIVGLENLKSLSKLFLSNNIIRNLEDLGIINGINKLTDFSIDGNPVSSHIPTSFLTEVEEVNLHIINLAHIYFRVHTIRSMRSVLRLNQMNVSKEERHKADRFWLQFTKVAKELKGKHAHDFDWRKALSSLEIEWNHLYPLALVESKHNNFKKEHIAMKTDQHKIGLAKSGTLFKSRQTKYKTIFSSLKYPKKSHYEVKVPFEGDNTENLSTSKRILFLNGNVWDFIDWTRVYTCTHVVIHFVSIESICEQAGRLFQNLPHLVSLSLYQNNFNALYQCLCFKRFPKSSEIILSEVNISSPGNNVQDLYLFRELLAFILPNVKSLNGVIVSEEEYQRGKLLFTYLLDLRTKQLQYPPSQLFYINSRTAKESKDDILEEKLTKDKENISNVKETNVHPLSSFCHEKGSNLDPLAFEALAIYERSNQFEEKWPRVMKTLVTEMLELYLNRDLVMDKYFYMKSYMYHSLE